jgi:H+-transporting ATPase
LREFSEVKLEIKDTSAYKTIVPEETLVLLETTVEGLSEPEAERRQSVFGRNEVTEKRRPAILDFFSRWWGPMPWLLELTMILSYALGHILEAGIILILLSVNTGIGFWNERNSRKALELLKSKLSVGTNVRRDGRWVKKNARDLVPGDIVGVGLGDIVAADLKLIGGEISVDQSALTGESLPTAL